MTQMNPIQARAAWVAALRSDEYKQGTTFLSYSKLRFCCLGVACELAIKDGVPVEVRSQYPDMKGPIIYDDGSGAAPERVMNWLGLEESNGGYYEDGVSTSLARKNDCGFTFAEIAEIIESSPKGLFKDAECEDQPAATNK